MKKILLFCLLLASSLSAQTTTTLTWAPATDNLSSQASLLYEVRQSASANIATVDQAEVNGVVVLPYSSALTATISGGAGYFYNVIVKDEAGNKAAYRMVGSTPVVSIQPQTLRIRVGQLATFYVTAAGPSPFTYRWRRNGVIIPGATSTSYTLVGVLRDNNALFSVAVSNPYGTTISKSVTLHVRK